MHSHSLAMARTHFHTTRGCMGGGKGFKGLNAFFKYLEEKSYKIQFRVMLSRYRGRTTCPECQEHDSGKPPQCFHWGQGSDACIAHAGQRCLGLLPIFVAHEHEQKSPNDSSRSRHAPELPLRCGTWLPHTGSIQQNAKWRRIAAHCLEHLSGQQSW